MTAHKIHVAARSALDRFSHLTILRTWVWCMLLLAAPMLAQVSSEDLDLDEPALPREIEILYAEAEALFQTVDQSETVPMFTQVIDTLEPMRFEGDPAVLEALQGSLVYRASANFNIGDSTGTEADLERLIRMDPTFDLDRTQMSSKLVQLFDDLRGRLVGTIDLLVTPSDATINLDGQPLVADGGPIPILAGSYAAEIVRPGYTPTTLAFDVVPGETLPLEAELVRSSAVISVRTSPAGAEVLIDGILRAETDGPAEPEFVPPAGSTRSDFSTMSLLAAIEPGQHIIEVRYGGFRSYRASLDVTEPRDFILRPVVLEAEAGTVVFKNLDSGAVAQIDGKPVRPRRTGESGQEELILAPGSYRLSVSKGTLGVFETQVEVRDREAVEVDVALRPALILAGILGGDEVGARRLKDALTAAFNRSGHWALLDRTAEGPQLLAGSGVGTDTLRRLAERGTPTDGSVDWQQVQAKSDAQIPGAVYILAVLSDDLIAQAANLWAWPAAPGPSRPDILRLSLDAPDQVEQLASAFRPALDAQHIHLGALLVDSAAGAGPVVAHLTEGGSGAKAGLRAGDEITAVDGSPVFNVSQFEAKVTASVGKTLRIEASRSGQTLTMDIAPEQSHTVVDVSDPNLVRAAAAAELNTELARESDRSPRWLLQLNHAAILLRSGDYESAVRELRKIETPSSQGLGRATVDYWIGLALLRLSVQQASYIEPARASFQRAADVADGRLFHDAGPFIAARAKARLARLGGGQGRP